MITRKIQTAIRRHKLLQPGQHILVGVSGGADSIALLALLHELAPAWKLRLTAAHLNHGIRGADADQDARFVRSFVRRLGVGFIEGRANVPRLARRKGVSLEMAGREARYAFFADAARRRHCDVIATAHTANDQAETILLKLARGAGAQGLAGIPFTTRRYSLMLIRPLRDISRAEIIQFLRRRRLTWREDLSNADAAYLRNRVRHEVLPFLETRLNPRICQVLARTADILDKENEWLNTLAGNILSECAKESASGNTLNCRILASHPLAARRRVLRQWLVACGLDPNSLDFDAAERMDDLLMTRPSGRGVTLPGGWIVRKQGQCLHLDTAEIAASKIFRVPLRIPGTTLLPQLGLRIKASLAPGIYKDKPLSIGQYPARASLSVTAWRRRRMVARSWQAGDRMAPLGMAGSKKVQDIFVDGKVPGNRRPCIPLFECGGELVWMPGYRIARGWEVHDSARQSLQLAVTHIH